MDRQAYIEFSKNVLHVEFKDIDLLITAFTHRSYLNEHRKTVKVHNERLEFLGDAVLELIVTEYLYLNYSQPEGVLTNWRSSLVRTESLADCANKLNFENYLRLSKGESRGSLRARRQILANSFEAVLGAIYLDQGYILAAAFVNEHIVSRLEKILKEGSWLDAKSKLQELTQQQEALTPIYRVISEEGPDHDKNFKIGVYLNQTEIGVGSGASKHIAQQNAAEVALKKYKKITSD